jgi:hypothetical protein
MPRRTNVLLIAAALLVAATPLAAQMMGMMPPSMSGVWNPVVGSGATYEMVDKNGQKQTLTFAVVSKDESGGQTGYWEELQMTDKNGKPVVVQMLMLKDGTQITMPKMIVQSGSQPPMEMSMSTIMAMGGRGGFSAPPPPKADFRESAERVGSESVTTPAGTFQCEHWRNKDGSGDVWFTPSLAPWGLVKMTSEKNGSMIVTKVITNAKSHIVGTPMNMDDMMNGRGRGRGL